MEVRATWRVSIRRACNVTGTEASTYHYKGRRADQAVLVKRIRKIAKTRMRYGYRRIHVLLRREKRPVNAKRMTRTTSHPKMSNLTHPCSTLLLVATATPEIAFHTRGIGTYYPHKLRTSGRLFNTDDPLRTPQKHLTARHT